MRKFSLLAGMAAVVALVGCSDGTLPSAATLEQSSESESLRDEQGPLGGSGGEGPASPAPDERVEPDEASGTSAPTVAAQAPGSALVVTGAELAAPAQWHVSGVSSDDSSEVVSARSDDGQFISLRSVRSIATVQEQIAEAFESGSDQTVEAPAVDADGEILRGVQTSLTASGGQAVQLQYFMRRGDSLVTVDVVTTPEQQQALLEHLDSSLTWR